MDTKFFELISPLVADAVEHTELEWEVASIKHPSTISFTAHKVARSGKIVVRYCLIITESNPFAEGGMAVHLVRECCPPEKSAEEMAAWANAKVRPVQAMVTTSAATDWKPVADGTPLETVIRLLMASVQEDAAALILKADGVLNV